jgi:hypothetical protein
LVLVPIDNIQNIFEFGQGLTSPVRVRKLPFLGQVAPLFCRTPGNCWIFGFSQWISPGWVKTKTANSFLTTENRWSGNPDPLKSKFRPFLTQITKKKFYDEIWIFSAKFYEYSKILGKSLKNTKVFFWNFSKNGRILDFSGSGLTDHRFSFDKKLFFLSFYPPWTDSLWKTEDSVVSWRSVEQRCNLAQKWSFWSPNGRGQPLTKFKNILYGVYWDQYQGFKTPAFWLNV